MMEQTPTPSTPSTPSTPLEFSSHLILDEIRYCFSLTLEKSIFSLTVTKPLDSTYWEGNIDYKEYQQKYLIAMKKESFFLFLKKVIQLKKFEMKINDKSLILKYFLESGLEDFMEKSDPLFIVLDKQMKDIPENVSIIATHLQKLENNYEQFKNKVEVEIKDCEENTKKRIN